jgi:hypothetical protein
MPSFGQADHRVEHFLDHLRVERRGRLVEQHDLGLHAQRAGDGDALLLAARKLAGIFVCLLGDRTARGSAWPVSSASVFFGILRTQIGASVSSPGSSGAGTG